MIYLYDDCIHNNRGAYKALTAYAGHDHVRLVDADDVRAGCLNASVKAFVMPGGASRYVANKLNGRGNDLIRDYVAQGGLYVGICAGAYYACRRTEWRTGQKDQLHIDNELGFFQGVARGDLVETSIQKISFTDGNEKEALYWGGPGFFADDQQACFQVLARYATLPDKPAAIVSGTYQRGRYLLLGPHLDIDDAQLQLMQFDVVQNRHDDLKQLGPVSGLTLDMFRHLLDAAAN